MRRFLFVLILHLSPVSLAFATWSIILIDPETKEIGISGASCSYNCFDIGEIISDHGAIIVQAMSSNAARQKGIQLILAGASPEEIIRAMRDPAFDPERQQYAVVSLNYLDNPLAWTGDSTHIYKGALTGYGVSVQGNTLANEGQLRAMLEAVSQGRGEGLPIAEILMKALEAGAETGGDQRCGEQRATSAFLMVAGPGDRKPFMELQIFGQRPGGQSAVVMLRTKIEKWKKKHE